VSLRSGGAAAIVGPYSHRLERRLLGQDAHGHLCRRRRRRVIHHDPAAPTNSSMTAHVTSVRRQSTSISTACHGWATLTTRAGQATSPSTSRTAATGSPRPPRSTPRCAWRRWPGRCWRSPSRTAGDLDEQADDVTEIRFRVMMHAFAGPAEAAVRADHVGPAVQAGLGRASLPAVSAWRDASGSITVITIVCSRHAHGPCTGSGGTPAISRGRRAVPIPVPRTHVGAARLVNTGSLRSYAT